MSGRTLVVGDVQGCADELRDLLAKVAFVAGPDHLVSVGPRARRSDLRFLDTGCVYGRRLTGWLVEEDRMVSVPARRAYWAIE